MDAVTPRKPDFSRFRRVTVKVGSSLLVARGASTPRTGWLKTLVGDVAELRSAGAEVMVVSSGAIALGRGVLGLPPGALKLEDSQAAAAVGQIALARLWAETLAERGIVAGQVLLTLRDTEERRRYLNARATMGRLLAMGAVPVVNENDTVATSEIRYGDNDRLAARVAAMAGADLLVLFSDVAGLYDSPPHENPAARLIPVVERLSPEIEAMAGGPASEFARGGMRTKLEAARIAVAGGVHMVIADGRGDHPLASVARGGDSTWFLAPSNPVAARKAFIGGSLEPKGVVHVDSGAARALAAGKSLLPAGVVRVEGEFQRGDCVVLRDGAGRDLGRGLVAYDAAKARRICGVKSADIEAVLGAPGRAEMIHRDDMALAAGA
ncbi:MAG: glutamate 5-kinase [Hyphomicrobiales bacterium]|nr:glutamate 5-kinase [Hyphomicrobiales bacterium]MDE2016757.1 glutamate 5-kinase [Hyphomicrobiales bacterium]